MFPVLFAIPRTAGWIAQWEEMLLDPEQKIARPKQVYIGSARRDYVPREQAGLESVHDAQFAGHKLQRSRDALACSLGRC